MRMLKADWRGECARGTNEGNVFYDLYVFRGHAFRVCRSDGRITKADEGDIHFIKECAHYGC